MAKAVAFRGSGTSQEGERTLKHQSFKGGTVEINATDECALTAMRSPFYPQAMKVSAEYAQEHFADIAGAADRGEDVEIERAGKPQLRLIVDKAVTVTLTKKRLVGAAKGKIWLAEDWDSVQTNKEIQDLFEGSSLSPEATAG